MDNLIRFKDKANLKRICVYFCDENDHYSIDFYLHFNDENDWNDKYKYLSDESAKKIYKYIYETYGKNIKK